MKDKDIKYYLDNFDLNGLDAYENLLYNNFRTEFPKRLSLLKLINTNKVNSYALTELKELIQEQDAKL
jgi:hypothetical protein